jgi:hypothetical protein
LDESEDQQKLKLQLKVVKKNNISISSKQTAAKNYYQNTIKPGF